MVTGHWRSQLAVTLGAVVFAIGAKFAISATVYSVPQYAAEQIKHPMIEVLSTAPGQYLTVTADFRYGEYSIRLFPLPLDVFTDPFGKVDKIAPINPAPIWLIVKGGILDFDWKITNGFTEFINPPAGEAHLTGKSNGTGRHLLVRGDFDSHNKSIGITFKEKTSHYAESGPYKRFSYPSVEGPQTQGLNLATGDTEVAPLIGDTHVYTPNLGIIVLAPPVEQFDSNLTEVKLSPELAYSPPMVWHARQRFIADILFRDTKWDQRAQVKTFVGGVFVGIGTSVMLLPLAPLIEANRRETRAGAGSQSGPVGSRKRRRERTDRPRSRKKRFRTRRNNRTVS